MAYAAYLEQGGSLARDAHDQLVADFADALEEVWAGAPAIPRLLELAHRLHLTAPRRADQRRYPPPVAAPTEQMMVRIATDLVPAIGNAAPSRVLGPWATQSPSPRLLQVAVAAGLFMEPDDLPMTAFRRWAGRTPVPPVEERHLVRAALHAPFTAWPMVEPLGHGCWALGPPVGGGAPVPRALVPHPALLPHAPPPAPGHTLLGRVVPVPGQPVVVCPIVAPITIPSACEAWLDLITLRHRLEDRRASTADVLRHRGHVLVRRVLESAWLA